MDSVKVAVSGGQGVGSHNITDLWVEANNVNVGAYGIPCKFPVLQENEVRFVVSAGIKESGQSGVRVIYPFYSADTFSINCIKGESYYHKPVFKYVNSAQFSFTEDFEFGNSFGPSSNFILVSGAEVDSTFGDSRCLKFSVNAVDSSKEISYNIKYDLPEGQEIWLEVDYKSEVPFYAGFYGTFNGNSVIRVPVLFITPQPEWHKVYIKLSNYVGSLRADTYNVYFEALRPYGSTGGNGYIDNVKLVHF